MVRYREIRPSAKLGLFIDCFWILEDDGAGAAPQRVVPDGRAELILNWKQPFDSLQGGQWVCQPRCFLAGQLDGPLLLRSNGPAKILGIRFHPHGAARVFPQPMRELTGRFTLLEDLSPALARSFTRALESPDPVASVEAALGSAQRSRAADLLVAEAVRRIAGAKGALDLGILARELGLSIRQLERRFDAVVGLTPKVFGRIQRFNSVFHVLGDPSLSWVETAIACGYYDQAHLIHDCKSLSGATPSALLAAEADFARHFYLRDGMSHSYNTARRAAV